MPRFAANLSLLFTERPFLDRFAAAADAGFRAVEMLFPYAHPPETIAAALDRAGLALVLFNLPPGDWEAGERGLAALPGRESEIAAGIETGLAYALATGCRRVHLMAGIAERSDPAAGAAYENALATACGRLAPHGIAVMVEPINRRSMPGYFLDDVDEAARIVTRMRAAGHANLFLQFDLFHAQIIHGDVTARLTRLLPLIGHIQVASVPERNEPGTGELDETFLFARLDALGYRGHVGCEYHPKAGTEAGLRWFSPWQAPAGTPAAG